MALAFRPVPGAIYQVRVEERHQVYQSKLVFKAAADSWETQETGFAFPGSFALNDLEGCDHEGSDKDTRDAELGHQRGVR
jgi:hypothetical protein